MRRAIPFRAARLNTDAGSSRETNEVGHDGSPPLSGETSGYLSRGIAFSAAFREGVNQGGTARACLSSLEMKANAKAGVFQGEMASPFLLAERPLGQVGRSI